VFLANSDLVLKEAITLTGQNNGVKAITSVFFLLFSLNRLIGPFKYRLHQPNFYGSFVHHRSGFRSK